MARPRKQVVDYFPHDGDASEGKTLSILFNHFGHEGISAWWLLLERISRTRNHNIRIGNPEDLEFLAAKMHFTPERLQKILSKMAELDAIDKPLFEAGIIWSQNFVDNLTDVYGKREGFLPSKPELLTTETNVSDSETKFPIPESTQTKQKETKGNKTKVFKPPTFKEVIAYCLERNNGVDPNRWFNHYESNGWKVGKNKMVDWKAAVRTWEGGNHGKSISGNKETDSGRIRPGHPDYGKPRP